VKPGLVGAAEKVVVATAVEPMAADQLVEPMVAVLAAVVMTLEAMVRVRQSAVAILARAAGVGVEREAVDRAAVQMAVEAVVAVEVAADAETERLVVETEREAVVETEREAVDRAVQVKHPMVAKGGG